MGCSLESKELLVSYFSACQKLSTLVQLERLCIQARRYAMLSVYALDRESLPLRCGRKISHSLIGIYCLRSLVAQYGACVLGGGGDQPPPTTRSVPLKMLVVFTRLSGVVKEEQREIRSLTLSPPSQTRQLRGEHLLLVQPTRNQPPPSTKWQSLFVLKS